MLHFSFEVKIQQLGPLITQQAGQQKVTLMNPKSPEDLLLASGLFLFLATASSFVSTGSRWDAAVKPMAMAQPCLKHTYRQHVLNFEPLNMRI